MRERIYPESAAVYLPDGTKDRLRTIAVERGIPASTLMRAAVLDRIRQEERELNSESAG